MKKKYVIQNLENKKFLDYYCSDYYETGNLDEVRNMKYDSEKEAETNLIKDSLSGTHYTIIKIYIND